MKSMGQWTHMIKSNFSQTVNKSTNNLRMSIGYLEPLVLLCSGFKSRAFKVPASVAVTQVFNVCRSIMSLLKTGIKIKAKW